MFYDEYYIANTGFHPEFDMSKIPKTIDMKPVLLPNEDAYGKYCKIAPDPYALQAEQTQNGPWFRGSNVLGSSSPSSHGVTTPVALNEAFRSRTDYYSITTGSTPGSTSSAQGAQMPTKLLI